MSGKCVTPVVKDIAPINKTDIIMFLPQPESVGGTRRVAACLQMGSLKNTTASRP